MWLLKKSSASAVIENGIDDVIYGLQERHFMQFDLGHYFMRKKEISGPLPSRRKSMAWQMTMTVEDFSSPHIFLKIMLEKVPNEADIEKISL